jgi:hypothetical protein
MAADVKSRQGWAGIHSAGVEVGGGLGLFTSGYNLAQIFLDQMFPSFIKATFIIQSQDRPPQRSPKQTPFIVSLHTELKSPSSRRSTPTWREWTGLWDTSATNLLPHYQDAKHV